MGVWSKGPCQTTACASDPPSSMATVHKQRNVWCNNYRVRPEYVSDSDSDSGCASDVAADAVAKADSSDARMMRDMDLSSRHETVEYHANPWSIARINAASRSSLAKPTPTARTPGPAPSLPKPQPKPIVEAFKKQAKRGLREGQPIVRNVSNPGDHFVDKFCTTKHDGPSAKKSRQGCERTQTTHLAQVRVCPQPTELSHPPSPAHNPQTGSAIRGVTVLEKEKSAHISTPSNRFIQPTRVPPPFKPRRIIGAHRAARSSPVRLVAPQSTPDARHAVRDRPMIHHSSPGPRSHVPVTGKTLSNPGTGLGYQGAPCPQRTSCAHHYPRLYLHPGVRIADPQGSPTISLRLSRFPVFP